MIAIDLEPWIDVDSLPVDECVLGIAQSPKGVSTFYGDKHVGNYDPRIGDRTAYRWHNALTTGAPIESFSIGLNAFFGDYWWARFGEAGCWQPNANMQRFPRLQAWIRNQNVFESLARQAFFLNIHGQTEVHNHQDYDPAKVPEQYRAPPDFIWITPKPQKKRVYVEGNELQTSCCWFDTSKYHRVTSEGVAWSFRVDGVFTKEFKDKIGK